MYLFWNIMERFLFRWSQRQPWSVSMSRYGRESEKQGEVTVTSWLENLWSFESYGYIHLITASSGCIQIFFRTGVYKLLLCNQSILQEMHLALSYIKENYCLKLMLNVPGRVIKSEAVSICLQRFHTWMVFLSKLLNSINRQERLHYRLATNIGCLLKLLQKRWVIPTPICTVPCTEYCCWVVSTPAALYLWGLVLNLGPETGYCNWGFCDFS
jgi:hypothetical protein